MLRLSENTLSRNALILFFVLVYSGLSAQPEKLSSCNIKWTTQSNNSSGSMPCGGGDIGLNVWVENGEILFYLSRSGSFDENNQMLKLGRVRLKLSSNTFNTAAFSQELRLREGGVIIRGEGTEVNIWVDVFRPVVHVNLKTTRPVKLQAVYESWRSRDHLIEGTEFRANSYKSSQDFSISTTRDSIAFLENKVLFFHRPRPQLENIFDYTVRLEGMSQVKDQMFDPLKNNTFGGMMLGENMVAAGRTIGRYAEADFAGYILESRRPARQQDLEVVMNVAQSASISSWKAEVDSIISNAKNSEKTALLKTRAWWRNFWDRSYIFIDGPDSFVSRNYQLFRYQLACNAYGRWPTKFNGGLFCFDPVYVDKRYKFSPDFRLWGGGTMTAQNQRLVYYPMIKAGDCDMMIPQFDFYLNALRNAELRSELYWHHKGACFTEQIENFGLPNIAEYGVTRPVGYDPGMEWNPWLEYLWDTVFEFCQMILETARYEAADIHKYMPLIESCLSFYDAHYRYIAQKAGSTIFTQEGKYVFYPSSAAESYKMTYNSTTVISALRVILARVLELPNSYLSDTSRKKWALMLGRLPELPVKTIGGKTVLAPAEQWARIQNSEAPQLYPVFPWGIYGIGKPGLDIAKNTYTLDTQVLKYKSPIGWRQYSIWAARLGMSEEAAMLTREKFRDGPHRFPSFWGPAFDWTPDHNWGGSAMIGLQEMLMQVDGRKIYLMQAWPKEWSGSFKLHAPYNTTVEGKISDGKVTRLNVTPQDRRKDIIQL